MSRFLIRVASAVSIALCAATMTAGIAASAARHSWRVLYVTSLDDSGRGTLRAAIDTANGQLPGPATVIRFAISGIISLASELPGISRPAVIDGTSAPGYVSGGPPVVEVDCGRHAGLRFAPGSDGSDLLGLAVDNAAGSGVTLDASLVTLDQNYIGLNLSGADLGNHGDGVYVTASSSGNFIGLNPSRAVGAVSNVISGNWGNGIVLNGSSGNTLVSNRIGTAASGGSGIGNRGNGIWITGRSAGNEIGGTAFVDMSTGQANNPTGSKGTVPPVFVVPPLGNLISGNRGNGILIDAGSRQNTLNGNFIGTTASGNAAIANRGNGVWINGGIGNSLVGCEFVNNPFVYYNVISGNRGNGLMVTDSRQTVVQGNFFGIGANNTAIVANRGDGILVGGSSADTQVGGVIPLGNVSAGNWGNGIEVTGRATGFVTFNTFGGLLAFKGAAPNGLDGLLITSTGGNNLVRTNVFSGNRDDGIELAGDASGVTVDPDIAGLSTNGQTALPNGGDGLRITGTAHGNVVGGSLRSVIPQNTFSGNLGYGLAIVGQAHDNRVVSTFIGTEIFGVKPLGNRAGGILIGGTAYRNTIGALTRPPVNLVSGNQGNGVTLLAGTHDNLVLSNFIGLNRFGGELRNTGRQLLNLGRRNVLVGNHLG